MISKLDEDAIRRGLKTRWLGRTITVLGECNSTNDVAKTMAEKGAPDGLVIVTETQTAGRGRLGHVWYSPRGGIWLSALVRTPQASSVNALPIVAALGVAKVVREHGVETKVRWPNDVVVDGRKIGGVLVESYTKGNTLAYAVVGLGINANFDPRSITEIRGTSTSIQALVGGHVNREELIVGVLSELEELYGRLQALETEELERLQREFDWSLGRRVIVRYEGKTIEGTVRDYYGLERVQIATSQGDVLVDNSGTISVEYEFDKLDEEHSLPQPNKR